jgi:hypothetical protein
MTNTEIFDLEGAHIERLAVRLGSFWHPQAAMPIPTPVTVAGNIAYQSHGVLIGYSFLNTDAGSVNTFQVFDGVNNASPLLIVDVYGGGSGTARFMGLPGIVISRGLFVTGSTTGTAVFYVVKHDRHA